jgi:hypothetical protein
MGPLGCLETSSNNYYYTLRNISEERSFSPLRGGSLKPLKYTHHLVKNCLMPRKSQKDNTAMRGEKCRKANELGRVMFYLFDDWH